MEDKDYPFQFPFPPYSIQMDFMSQLQKTLDDSNVGLFESPTGTGKSMSLICGTLQWYFTKGLFLENENENHENHENNHENASSSTLSWLLPKTNMETNNNRQDKAARREKIRLRLDTLRKKEKMLIHKNGIRILGGKGKKLKVHENSNLLKNKDNSIDDFAVDHYESEEDEDVSEEDEDIVDEIKDDDVIKIFFCSRTHTQLSQFIHEIKKTTFGQELKCVTLGSRRLLCINPEIQRLKNDTSMTDACLELQKKKTSEKRKRGEKTSSSKCGSCSYYDPSSQMLFRDHALVIIEKAFLYSKWKYLML